MDSIFYFTKKEALGIMPWALFNYFSSLNSANLSSILLFTLFGSRAGHRPAADSGRRHLVRKHPMNCIL
jgi:hypothetical protein